MALCCALGGFKAQCDIPKVKCSEYHNRAAGAGSRCRKDVRICQHIVNLGIAAALCFNVGWTVPLPSLAINEPNMDTAMEQQFPPIPKDFPPLPDLSVPAYEKMTLSNGLRVFLLEDHELGLVGGQVIVKGGADLEPEEKVGLARMTSAVQRSGGTNLHPADVLNSDLESMAARIEASSGVGTMSVGFRCLGEDLETVFSLFSDVVQRPLMPQDKLELIRGQLLGSISRRGDDAERVAAIQFRKLMYGEKSIYARVPEVNTVKSVSQNDILLFHKHVFRPDKTVLGIWGDFDSSKMKSLLEKEFSNWTKSTDSTQFPEADKPKPLEPGISFSEPKVYVFDRPGLNQGYVRMGELGTTVADPDIFALDVLDGVLNGFGGILFDEIRSKEGLAYSVSGGWSPAVEHRGIFAAEGETQVASVPKFLKSIKGVLRSIVERPISEERLAQAKEAALNSFVFNFSSREAQLARILTYDLFGIDQNLPFIYKKKVEEVTTKDILEAAQRHLHPDQEPVLIVTDIDDLKPHMSDFVELGMMKE